MQNITELRNSLLDNYSKMKSKEMELKEGKELANTAGKVLNSLKIELEYQSLTGNKKDIDFLK
jgi:hypothetical protein